MNHILEKISDSKDQLKTTPKDHQKSKTGSHEKPTIFLQRYLNSRNLLMVFMTQKLGSGLPTLKSSFGRDLKSHVVYETKCIRCGTNYVGQTSRSVTTRISEHQNKDSQVGQHWNVDSQGQLNAVVPHVTLNVKFWMPVGQ